MRIQIIGRFHSRSFGPWSIFAFVHVQFIHFCPYILSPVSETRHSPKKREGRLSMTRHNYVRSGKKYAEVCIPLKAFLAAINLAKGLFDASFCREFALYNYNHRDWGKFFSYVSFFEMYRTMRKSPTQLSPSSTTNSFHGTK